MTQVIFRELPGVAEIERQLHFKFRDRLLDDEAEELPHLINQTSVRLFGITQQDTLLGASETRSGKAPAHRVGRAFRPPGALCS